MPHARSRRRRGGFTLTESLLAIAFTAAMATSGLTLYLMYQRVWQSVKLQIEADRRATLALNRMLYGVGNRKGLRSARGSSVTLENASGGWNLSYVGFANQTNRIEFRSAPATLTLQPGNILLGTNIVQASAAVTYLEAELMVRSGIAEGRFTATNEVRTLVRWRY